MKIEFHEKGQPIQVVNEPTLRIDVYETNGGRIHVSMKKAVREKNPDEKSWHPLVTRFYPVSEFITDDPLQISMEVE